MWQLRDAIWSHTVRVWGQRAVQYRGLVSAPGGRWGDGVLSWAVTVMCGGCDMVTQGGAHLSMVLAGRRNRHDSPASEAAWDARGLRGLLTVATLTPCDVAISRHSLGRAVRRCCRMSWGAVRAVLVAAGSCRQSRRWG